MQVRVVGPIMGAIGRSVPVNYTQMTLVYHGIDSLLQNSLFSADTPLSGSSVSHSNWQKRDIGSNLPSSPSPTPKDLGWSYGTK